MEEELLHEITVSDLLERHSRRVSGLQLEHSRILKKKYESVIRKMISDLELAPEESFTVARSAIILSQVESELAALKSHSNREVEFQGETMIDQSHSDTIDELEHFKKKFVTIGTIFPRDAIQFSMEKKNYLFNNVKSNVDAYNSRLRAKMMNTISDGIIRRDTKYKISNNLRKVWNEEEWVVLRLLRTELHSIYNKSKLMGFQQLDDSGTVPNLRKALYHPLDSRTADDSLHLLKKNPVIPINKNFKYKWRGSVREFSAPPDRPNDRAVLIPIPPKNG